MTTLARFGAWVVLLLTSVPAIAAGRQVDIFSPGAPLILRARGAHVTAGGASSGVASGLMTEFTSAFIGSQPAFVVRPAAGPNGTISPSTPQVVAGGSTASFTLTPATGFVVDNVVGTCGGTLNGTIFTTTALTVDCTVAANFKPAPLPFMALDKTVLTFGAITSGAAFTAQTPAQAVRVTQAGAGTVAWTATPIQPWLKVSPAAGTGPAELTVSVVFVPAMTVPPTISGSIVMNFTGAGNTFGPINVRFKIQSTGEAPFGFFDTPTDNRTGVTGAVPFTGWALDDIGVTDVSVCRAVSVGEFAPPDPRCGGWGEIFVGSAVSVDGQRPDVAGQHPAHPANTRAGWGLMVLTNMLPNHGNGTYVFHAWAHDADGHSTRLGTRTMSCANALATLPFGTIDTPAQGGTASGSSYVNFGWALTPQPKTIPTDGSTITVLVDGVSQGNVTYNHYRADIATLFPGLNNSTAAIGYKVLDTTALTNGTHTIVWVVSDNQGAIEGLGSRFFTVSNSTAAVRGTLGAAPVSAPLDAAAVDALPLSGALLSARLGFDLGAPFGPVTPAASGQSVLRAEEVGRVEVRLGNGAGQRVAGYLRTAAGLTPLPIGSTLDEDTGAFIWAPGVGFVGSYDFVFVTLDGATAVARQEVRIVLQPTARGAVGPQVVIDTPTKQQDVGQPFMLAGWAADLGATVGTGINTIHVWAYPLAGGPPIFLGVADTGRRPDVAALYGAQFADAGYGLIVDGLTPGNYDLAVFADSAITGDFLPASVVRVTVR